MDDRGKPIFSKIQLFSPMICVLVDVLCYQSPFYTKKDYQAKVPAETEFLPQPFDESASGVAKRCQTVLDSADLEDMGQRELPRAGWGRSSSASLGSIQ